MKPNRPIPDVPRKRLSTMWIREDYIREIRGEAERLDRSESWVFETAWRVARRHVMAVPAVGASP